MTDAWQGIRGTVAVQASVNGRCYDGKIPSDTLSVQIITSPQSDGPPIVRARCRLVGGASVDVPLERSGRPKP